MAMAMTAAAAGRKEWSNRCTKHGGKWVELGWVNSSSSSSSSWWGLLVAKVGLEKEGHWWLAVFVRWGGRKYRLVSR
ncbi:MAG: hypothetical protein AOY29_09000 [Alcanivorax borkumensis]|nr:MAG: hypothetical protein AOY29_09000 [Alcanivorax borkumensis]